MMRVWLETETTWSKGPIVVVSETNEVKKIEAEFPANPKGWEAAYHLIRKLVGL